MTSKLPIADSEPQVAPDEIRAELEAILASRTFERSERLRRFLSYVCELTLRGEAARINEYLIGSEVFGRGPNYSPNEDSVVRRQAHALRQKLQEYYASEGRNSPVRVELPVGKYVPVFRKQQAPAPGTEAAGAKGPGAKRVPPLWLVAAAAGLAVVIFLGGWMLGRRHSLPGRVETPPPSVVEIWGPWLRDSTGVVLCFSNPLTTVVKYFERSTRMELVPSRFRPDPGSEAFLRRFFSLPPGGEVYLSATLSQGKIGESIAAVHLSTLFAKAGVPVRTTQSRFLTWETLRSANFILFGHNEANPWLDPLLDKYPFRLGASEGDKPRRIEIRQPAPGESREYRVELADEPNEATRDYALVSMIPGVDGRRNLLLINGLQTQATQMAAEYLTSPATLQELLGRLRAASPDHRGPWHFQIVLRTEVHDKVPTRAALAALRVVSGAP